MSLIGTPLLRIDQRRHKPRLVQLLLRLRLLLQPLLGRRNEHQLLGLRSVLLLLMRGLMLLLMMGLLLLLLLLLLVELLLLLLLM